MYDKRRIALDAHMLTNKYSYTQSDAWKQAWRFEKRRVYKSQKDLIEKVMIVSKYVFGNDKYQYKNMLEILFEAGIQVVSKRFYFEMYHNNHLEGYVYPWGKTYYVQKVGSTIKLNLSDYANEFISRNGRSNGSRVLRRAKNYDVLYT
jgi:hypothetical protein